MNEDEKIQQRVAFLEALKEAKIINMDAPISSIFNATRKLPEDSTKCTVVYDSDKYFSIMK